MEKAAAGNASRAQPTIATCAIGPEIRTDSRPQTSPPSYKPDRIARCLPPIASTSAKLAPGIVRDAPTTPFMAQLHLVIAGDGPESCEVHLA